MNIKTHLAIHLLFLVLCSTAVAVPPLELQPNQEVPRLDSAPEAAPVSPEPPKTNEHHVQIALQHALALKADNKNGRLHLALADTLVELVSQVKELPPNLQRVEMNSDLSEERKKEIRSQVNALCIDYDGVRPLRWLVGQGDEAEPFVFERLQKAHNYEKPRLQEVLATHWRNLAIQHFALAHNLSCQQDIASFNPAFGEPWVKFTALNAGKKYLQMTAWRTDEESRQQAERVRATFDAVRKKQSEYTGPVR